MRLESSLKKGNKEETGRLNKLEGFTFGKALVFLVALVMLTSFAWADSNGVWHNAEDVRPGIFGADENPGNFIFNDTVEFHKDVYYKGAELDALYINAGETGDNLQDNTVDNSEIQNTGSFTFGGITSNGNLDMNNNDIKQAKYIYGNRFYDRDDTSYAVEPASNSNMRELTLTGVLRMNDNNVGGKNGQGVRKVNFENHEWGHFSCSDNDDVAGSLFYDRSEGVALCRKGNIEELADKNYVDNKIAGISDTDAATHCSGNNVFLDGNGNCRDITNNYGSPIHGDLIQSNTVDGGEIDEGSLDCSQITGGGGLCDGNDNVGATESYVDSNSINVDVSNLYNCYTTKGEKECSIGTHDICFLAGYNTTVDDSNDYDGCLVDGSKGGSWNIIIDKHDEDSLECFARCLDFS